MNCVVCEGMIVRLFLCSCASLCMCVFVVQLSNKFLARSSVIVASGSRDTASTTLKELPPATRGA